MAMHLDLMMDAYLDLHLAYQKVSMMVLYLALMMDHLMEKHLE